AAENDRERFLAFGEQTSQCLRARCAAIALAGKEPAVAVAEALQCFACGNQGEPRVDCVAARSLLSMSRATFQSPFACCCSTTRYLPLSATAAPPARGTPFHR